MKKYFIQTDKGQEGPFSVEELSLKGITAKTMIWFEGISNWTEAKFIPELKEFATPIPPPFENKNNNKSTDTNINAHQNPNPMTGIKTKSYKIPFIISLIIIAILFVFLLSSKSTGTAASNIDKKIFRGIWTLESEYDSFELNPDNLTYKYYQHNSETNFKGHWDITTLTVNGETIDILLLKNEIPTTGNKSYPEEKYYQFYIFRIDKIENGEIYVTHLSGNDRRRNEQNRLVKK